MSDEHEHQETVIARLDSYAAEAKGAGNKALARRLMAGIACVYAANCLRAVFSLTAVGIGQQEQGKKDELKRTHEAMFIVLEGLGASFEAARSDALGGFGNLAGQLHMLALDAEGAGDAELAYDMRVCATAAETLVHYEAAHATATRIQAATEPGEKAGHLMAGWGQAGNVKGALDRFEEVWKSAA